MDSIQKIKMNYKNLTSKQKEITDYLLANPENICYISLKDLSERTSSSEVTILRMCKKLGFNSFIDMKKAFRTHTELLFKTLSETSLMVPDMPLTKSGDDVHLLQQISANEYKSSREFFKTLDFDKIFKASKAILNAESVLICGHGISTVVGNFLYRRLLPLGINAVFFRPEEMDQVQANLARLKPGSHLVVITFPRYYTPVHNIALFAEQQGATVTAITDSLQSPAVTTHSLNFLCRSSTKMFYNSLALPIALVNLIASGIVIEMGPKYEQLLSDAYNIMHFINDTKADEE